MRETTIIQKTLRVPALPAGSGNDGTLARQLDAVLLTAGFKAGGDLLAHLSELDAGVALDRAVLVLGAVRELVGDHVEHNVYFRDFPAGVPDTVEFWLRCLTGAVGRERLPKRRINLLDLPRYGRYLHSYAEMVAAHQELIPSIKDRVTVLHLGASLEEETRALYLSLAGDPAPLNDADLALLTALAVDCVDGPQPESVPAREQRAVLNHARLLAGKPLLADTVTDVLRVACALSEGDVRLVKPTRFRSLPRARRRTLLSALDEIVRENPGRVADVNRYREPWKRLGERLHPYEFGHLPHAQDVFAVAYGTKVARSLPARAEIAFAAGDVTAAVDLLAGAPGLFFRALDRILRSELSEVDMEQVLTVAGKVVHQVSGRVLLSLREHLMNRETPDAARIFVNRAGRAWAGPDDRATLSPAVVERVNTLLDAELSRRLPAFERLVIDPELAGIAMPFSGQAKEDGFGVLPRGSVVPVDGETLRLFVYWRERARRTDYDLSLLLLDDEFRMTDQVSYTNLSVYGATHSGDLTTAADGASEFIDIDLGRVGARYAVPQVNVFDGENFDEVAEVFFGFMVRSPEQKGLPFEPRTVRMKSGLRGSGRVLLPLVFRRGDDGRWAAKWLHLYLRGHRWANRVEGNRVSASMLARAVTERAYLPVSHLTDLLAAKAGSVVTHRPWQRLPEPVTYLGLARPEGLHPDSAVYPIDRITELIPA
ncbi:TerD family protein [Amycolatopsis albispora]|uniref:TerD domain-containing protein n=1 Tax=Amycolatopsis albispora TaxID=1804986 RepID=A0A344LH10_9PSEU|nr:TerD family protein [Amycolatopsis albispora]AXB47334.1 hypothetical protein A4R43_36825 [Amycolatopsis albispora]